MIKQESRSLPHVSSASARKRRRTDEFENEPPTMTRTTPMDDAQDIPDMWDMPFVISKDAWAVTRCLDDHGNHNTMWSAAHFVAVAMWSGGVTAGIQAAKAIRIFRIWSPHGEDRGDELPSIKVKTKSKHILSKIWPLEEYEQKPLLDRANRLRPEEPFKDFDEAHEYLLHLCIGPDLTNFPVVVRPRLQRTDWNHLITETQFCKTLAPILYKYFDRSVDLAAASKPIVGRAIDGRTLNAYAGTFGYGTVKQIKTDGRVVSRRGHNREKNLLQEDDYEDDEEDFGLRPDDLAVLKREPDPRDKDDIEFIRQRPCIQRQKHKATSHAYIKDDDKELDPDVARSVSATPTADAHSIGLPQARDRRLSTAGRTDESKPLSERTANGDIAATPDRLDCPAGDEPLTLNKRIINQLYAQTCDIPSHRIYSFSESRNPQPALPKYWKEICTYRELRDALASASKYNLPWPREPKKPVYRGSLAGAQKQIDDNLLQHAEEDLVKIERFCRPIIID